MLWSLLSTMQLQKNTLYLPAIGLLLFEPLATNTNGTIEDEVTTVLTFLASVRNKGRDLPSLGSDLFSFQLFLNDHDGSDGATVISGVTYTDIDTPSRSTDFYSGDVRAYTEATAEFTLVPANCLGK